MAVPAQALGDDQPVDIGAHGEADGRPRGVGEAAQIRKPRQAHQQPAAHVGRFGAHRGHKRPETAAAEVEIIGGLIFAGIPDADADDDGQIDNDRNEHADFSACHETFPPIKTERKRVQRPALFLFFSLFL